METPPTAPAAIQPLAAWVNLHPAAFAPAGEVSPTTPGGTSSASRSRSLAQSLAEANRRWGNPVDQELDAWLAGADVIVTGQQPGLLGGPLLTLVKACAVAAEVAHRRAAGRPAVGFLWLATADDDLPEMGWVRLALGEEIVEKREATWERGAGMGGTVAVGAACSELLAAIGDRAASPFAQEVTAFGAACYAPGTPLGEATARFLARLLAGTGVVLVDALDPELARAGSRAVGSVLERLPRAWDALRSGETEFSGRGWPLPMRVSSHKLPVFARRGDRRESIASAGGACPTRILEEHSRHPERFVPNVWLRPLQQDAALGTSLAILGGAELAYHREAGLLWELAGVSRPLWRLRPHVTIVTSVERRLARQLRVEPGDLLRSRPPAALLAGRKTRRQVELLRRTLEGRLAALGAAAAAELPALGGDVDGTTRKLLGALEWLQGRVDNASVRDAEVNLSRWRRLLAILRPGGGPQERELSVLAPLLRLGLDWPRRFVETIDPDHPGMHLLNWEEGGAW